MLKNKKDILLVNLKLSPVFLTISSYDQLFHEALTDMQGITDHVQLLESVKIKLKHYASGCLYRSKRAYLKMRALHQQTKRSNSNFSNGSSSCGRANNNATTGHNTGGRIVQGSNGNAPFSPLLHTQQVHTPNAPQNVTQRLEDIEQLYDEILDEEEEHERKILRIQKRKNRKLGLSDEPLDEDDSAGDDEDYEESMSMYEEDDYDIHQELSFEEELEELQSYRNQNPPKGPQGGDNPHFLNESTADFNKEIKQINQELREQFGNDLTDMSQAINGSNQNVMPEHLQSFQSTQSLLNKANADNVHNTQKKNPISFKLDLSKCTNQQSEDDDEEYVTGGGGDDFQDIEGSLEIPGLQHVKVTDDSFRQFQKSLPSNNSKKQGKIPIPAVNENKEEQKTEHLAAIHQNIPNVLIDQALPKKRLGNNIIIPKLELSILNQHQSIPLKVSQIVPITGQPIKNLSGIQSLRSGKQSHKKVTTQNTEPRSKEEGTLVTGSERGSIVRVNQQQQPNQLEASSNRQLHLQCNNEPCLRLKEKMSELTNVQSKEKESFVKENKALRQIIQEIKDVFKLSAKGDKIQWLLIV